MKKSLMLAMVLATTMAATTALAAKKYYISIGCWPDYKMHRIGCDVGTSWKTCAREACYGIATSGDGNTAAKARRAEPDVKKEPKLLGPLPAEAR